MVLDKYIRINDRPIVVGQSSSGIWYTKELVANTTAEADKLIGEMNNICNKYNKDTIQKNQKIEFKKKEKKLKLEKQ